MSSCPEPAGPGGTGKGKFAETDGPAIHCVGAAFNRRGTPARGAEELLFLGIDEAMALAVAFFFSGAEKKGRREKRQPRRRVPVCRVINQ